MQELGGYRRLASLRGSLIAVRGMQPEDAPALGRFHCALSDDTTYLRFFSIHPVLYPNELHHFTHVDHVDREALVATIDGEIIGVARLERLKNQCEAEVAFVITDRWQGVGLGSILLSELAARARGLGIERFIAETLAQNHRMMAVFRRTGWALTTESTGGIVDVRLELPQ